MVRSAVGEANVVDVMEQSNAILGGEGNGGVIDPEVVKVQSITGMAMVLDLLAEKADRCLHWWPTFRRRMVKEKRELVVYWWSCGRSRYWRPSLDVADGQSTTSTEFGSTWWMVGCTFAVQHRTHRAGDRRSRHQRPCGSVGRAGDQAANL